MGYIRDNWQWLGPVAGTVLWVGFQGVRGYVRSKADADPAVNEWDHIKNALGAVKPWGKRGK